MLCAKFWAAATCEWDLPAQPVASQSSWPGHSGKSIQFPIPTSQTVESRGKKGEDEQLMQQNFPCGCELSANCGFTHRNVSRYNTERHKVHDSHVEVTQSWECLRNILHAKYSSSSLMPQSILANKKSPLCALTMEEMPVFAPLRACGMQYDMNPCI